LVVEHPLEKVSVSDVVEASGRNRKTFYYHFADKHALIVWVFRSDLARELKRRCASDDLVFETKGDWAEFPYYTFIKDGVRSINGAPFFQALGACVDARRPYYGKVLQDASSDGLSAYLHHLYVPALRDDIDFILSNRMMHEDNARFLAEFYTGAFIAYLSRRASAHDDNPVFQDAGPFANIIHAAIAEEITRQQQGRIL
jgi:AcrR family transcriptional regulator